MCVCVCVDLESKQHIHTDRKRMAPNWLFGGGDPAESSTLSNNTKRNHHLLSKNKNSQGERASTNVLSAQGYVKDERDDPHYSQKARRGRESRRTASERYAERRISLGREKEQAAPPSTRRRRSAKMRPRNSILDFPEGEAQPRLRTGATASIISINTTD